MIYQTSEGFFPLKFKATFTDGEETFEHYVNEEKEAEEYAETQNEFLGEGEKEISLKEITPYELEEDEVKRLEEIKDIKGITLDEVRKYVYEKEEPAKNAFWLMKKKDEEIEKLKLENQSLMFGMLDIASKLSELSTK